MNLYNISPQGKLELDPQNVAIPPFRDIWNRDRSKTKEKATKELSYIFYLCDYKSPYLAYGEHERELTIRKDFIKDEVWTPDDLVQNAIDKYRELQYTPILRMLNSALGVATKVSMYFDSVDFEKTDTRGNKIYDINDVLAAIDKVEKVVNKLKALEQKVKSEQMDNATVRGNSEIGSYEIPEI
jgi:hypothetical protein